MKAPLIVLPASQGIPDMPRTLSARLVMAAAIVLCGATAAASPPAHNELGARFTVLSRGSTNVIDIHLAPKSSFDAVRVEAGSGAALITPPCEFTAVAAGGSYDCRVNATHRSGAATLTIKVVGEKTSDPLKPKTFEVSHFTLANGAFVPAPAGKAPRASANLRLTPPKNAPKQQ